MEKSSAYAVPFQQTAVENEKKAPVRMAAIVPKYSPLLYTVLFLLLVDFVINSFSELIVNVSIAMLIIYM